MKFTLNGKPIEVHPHSDETTIDLLRKTLQLTGTKNACSKGSCGACTILVDGQPMLSCQVPAEDLSAQEVTTIEQFAATPLHPIQKAFIESDALQCGFCTPGFIMRAIHFFDNWREEHPGEVPTKQEIAAALNSNICRCGAYMGIYDAIEKACQGKYDKDANLQIPRVEAIEKVTGKAQFSSDVYLDKQLNGYIFRSPHPKGIVKKIDLSEVKALEQVKAVTILTPEGDQIQFEGQEIFAIALVPDADPSEAFGKATIEYEVQAAVLHPDEAIKDNVPLVYKDESEQEKAPNVSIMSTFPSKWTGNQRTGRYNLISFRPKNAKKRIKKAKIRATKDKLIQDKWTIAPRSHMPLETHVCVANWQSNGYLEVYASTQACDLLARQIAQKFNLHQERITVFAAHIGGAFGSKMELSPEIIAAIQLSKSLLQPVRIQLSRAEETKVAGYRPAVQIDLSIAASEKGKLRALSAKALHHNGIGINASTAALMRLVYPKGYKSLQDIDILTNHAPGKSFGAAGAAVATWALEQAVDRIAHQLKKDPLLLRKKWDPHRLRRQLYSYAAKLPIWENRPKTATQTGRFRRGVGVAMGNWFYTYQPSTEVTITASKKGIKVACATQDVGDGARSLLAKTVAETFNLSPSDIQVEIGHSEAPRGPMTAGNRTVSSLFYPTQKAAHSIRKQMLAVAKTKFTLKRAKITNQGIKHVDGLLVWKDILADIPVLRATAKRGKDFWMDPLASLPIGSDNLAFGRGFTGSIIIAEVQVDIQKGLVKPSKIWAGLASGKIVNQPIAISQCYGGIIQGIGNVLFEEQKIDPQSGQFLHLNFDSYTIPRLGNTPEIELYFLEKGFKSAKGQVAGLAELVPIAIPAAIGNAVFNATGWSPTSLPIRPHQLQEHFGKLPEKISKTVSKKAAPPPVQQ